MKLTPIKPKSNYFKGLYPDTPILAVSKTGVMRLNAQAAETLRFSAAQNYLKVLKDENNQLYIRPVTVPDEDTFKSQKRQGKEVHFSNENLKNELFKFANAPEAHLIRFKIKHYITHEGNAYYPLEVLEIIEK